MLEIGVPIKSLLLIGAIYPCIVLGVCIKRVLHEQLVLISMILSITFVHEAILFTFPIVFDLLSDGELMREMICQTQYTDLLIVIIGECTYVSLFIAILMVFRQRRKIGTNISISIACNKFTKFLLVIGVLLLIEILFRKGITIYELTEHAEVSTSLDILLQISGWLHGAYVLPSIICAGLIVSKTKESLLWRTLGGIILILIVYQGLATGLRGRISWAISVFIVGAILNRNRIAIYFGSAACILLFAVSPFMGGKWRSIAINELEGTSSTAAISRLLSEAKSGEAFKEENENIVKTMARRAQGPRNSIILYKLYDDDHGGGCRPILSSVLHFVPRFLWNSKGVAGSSDDTSYGAAIFIVRKYGYDAPYYNMGPCLASAHAYWEGGVVWLILAAIISGFFWLLILHCVSFLEIYTAVLCCLTFAGSYLIDGLFTAFSPVFAYILQFWNTLLPCACILWLLMKLTPSKDGYRTFRKVSVKAAANK